MHPFRHRPQLTSSNPGNHHYHSLALTTTWPNSNVIAKLGDEGKQPLPFRMFGSSTFVGHLGPSQPHPPSGCLAQTPSSAISVPGNRTHLDLAESRSSKFGQMVEASPFSHWSAWMRSHALVAWWCPTHRPAWSPMGLVLLLLVLIMDSWVPRVTDHLYTGCFLRLSPSSLLNQPYCNLHFPAIIWPRSYLRPFWVFPSRIMPILLHHLLLSHQRSPRSRLFAQLDSPPKATMSFSFRDNVSAPSSSYFLGASTLISWECHLPHFRNTSTLFFLFFAARPSWAARAKFWFYWI